MKTLTIILKISLLILAIPMATKLHSQFKLIKAEITSTDSVEITFSGKHTDFDRKDMSLSGGLVIKSFSVKDNLITLNTSEIDLSDIYFFNYKELKIKLEPGRVFDKFYTDKKLGWHIENGKTIFNIFAPRASLVKLVIFENYQDESGKEYFLSKENDGVWSLVINEELWNKLYAYRIKGPEDETEMFNPEVLIADPYSKHVVTKNSYDYDSRTLIHKEPEFDWEGTDWVKIPQEQLIIYETHLRDMTAHPSSQTQKPGTYTGFIEKDSKGGLNYIKKLGVNAVEFLPLHDFQNWEIPYKKEYRGFYNTWNPYERNHWGYMTTFFFAPENYYASDGQIKLGTWNGINSRSSKEFKEVVKALHKENIAVIMDVVYNHVSQYDFNPFKMIDKKYYFRLDKDMNFISESGCGNDFKTERPMARKMILESIKYWMTEYKIDGFRFDLAQLIDRETCRIILEEARKINPNVIIIAEPWGGGYDPAGFSQMGWAAWNDVARNGIKGQNPFTRKGFIFGEWDENVRPDAVKNFFLGTLKIFGGMFQSPLHSINYLESHDDNTLGDFIRLGIKKIGRHEKIKDVKKAVTLNKTEMKINKLAALALFSLQGPVMLHSGQEYARSKIIAPTTVPDTNVGTIDHNSYNKDNETNYNNYEHAEWNKELLDYYKGLIKLRKKYPQLSLNKIENIHFLTDPNNAFALGYVNKSENGTQLLVFLNGHSKNKTEISLPSGEWTVLVNDKKVFDEKDKPVRLTGKLKLNNTEGIILIKSK